MILCATRGWWEYRTAMFWVGMIVWEIVDEVSSKHVPWAVRMTGPATAIVILGAIGRTALMLEKPDTGMIPLMLCRTIITAITLSAFLWIAYFGPVWWKRVLSADQLRRLGAASYSFYLTHGFAIKAFRFGVIPWLGSAAHLTVVFWIGQLVGLIASVAIAVAVHSMVEEPLANVASAYFRSPDRRMQERPIAA
jgi:peptidoglycan/LPS O-acetylase OafA/YrhL